jgi:hypothetical protein
LDHALTGRGIDRSEISQRLSAIEDQLGTLTQKLGKVSGRAPAAKASTGSKPARSSKPGRASKPAARRSTKPAAKAKPKQV